LTGCLYKETGTMSLIFSLFYKLTYLNALIGVWFTIAP